MAPVFWPVATVVPSASQMVKTQTTGMSTESPNYPQLNHTASEGKLKPASAPAHTHTQANV